MDLETSNMNIFGINKSRIYRFISILFCVVMAVTSFFPLIWLVNFSFVKSNELFTNSFLVWPKEIQFNNYVLAWNSGKVPYYLVNSIITSFVSVALIVILSLMMAYGFNRMKWKFNKVFLNIVLLGIMIPIHATLLPNFLTFNAIGLINTRWALIIPYVAFGLAQATFIMTGFMNSIPETVEESAILEGCNVFRLLFQIIMPMMKPAIATVIIISFIAIWNEFIMAATFLSGEELKTLPFSVQNFTGLYTSNYSAQFAVMVLAALPALVIYIIFNKQITKGLITGAVKG